MPDDLERLRRQVEDGIQAAEKLQRLLAETKRDGHHRKPKFKLIKGSFLGGVVWAGVEWFRDYRRGALALLATGVAVSGATVLAEQDPGPPSTEPPAPSISIKPTPTRSPVSPPPPSKTVATPGPTFTVPPRTSPLRTLGTRVIKPTTAPSRTPSPSATPSPSTPPAKPPTATPTILATPSSIKVTPSLTVTPPVTVRLSIISTTCPGVTSDLIEVKLCLPLGR